MIPKEKAGELIEKFFKVNDNELSKKGCNPFIDRDYAKKCALITVDELINATQYESHMNFGYNDFETIEYWEEVKLEIISYDNI